jgi:hypothetical protein
VTVQNAMYSMNAYFLEVICQRNPDDGWSADARFSRRNDYRKHTEVVKVVVPLHLAEPTRASAEKAAVFWAREFVSTSSSVLESLLRLEEEASKPD